MRAMLNLDLERPDSRAGIADGCPSEAREALRLRVSPLQDQDCLLASEVLTVLSKPGKKAENYFGNWLTFVPTFPQPSEGWRSATLLIPVVLLRQFVDALPELPPATWQALGAALDVKPPKVDVQESGSSRTPSELLADVLRPLEYQAQVLRAMQVRWMHRAVTALAGGLSAASVTADPAPEPAPDENVAQAVNSERERCLRICADVSALFPEAVFPGASGGAEAAGGAMARLAAERIAKAISVG